MQDGTFIVLKLSGRIEADGLSELKKACAAAGNTENVVLDLAEVDLAGHDAVKFLAACEQAGTTLRNCPAYVRDWITRERNGGNSQ
jgi:anti-anti-sigma regulatory factor